MPCFYAANTYRQKVFRDDVICILHVGGITIASKQALWREALRGEHPTNLVNPKVWPIHS
jgi:hypothetical protein